MTNASVKRPNNVMTFKKRFPGGVTYRNEKANAKNWPVIARNMKVEGWVIHINPWMPRVIYPKISGEE